MPLNKHEHWRTRAFAQYLLANADTPFTWGTHDCCLFAANAIQAYTDVDIASDFRGKYTTEMGAMKAIVQIAGGSTVADAVAYCARKHGLVEHKFPLMAKRGDLVIATNADGTQIAGIVHLNGREVVSVSDSGAVRLSISKVVRSWGV